MALWRYVGPHPEVSVRVAGNDLGIVEQGGSIAVDDELAKQVEWGEDWEDASKDTPDKKKERERQKAIRTAGSKPADAPDQNEDLNANPDSGKETE